MHHVALFAVVLKAKIDDPLDAFAVHGACGAWGVIAAALFSTDTYSKGGKGGLFYGDGDKLGVAVVFILAVSAWSATLSTAVCHRHAPAPNPPAGDC